MEDNANQANEAPQEYVPQDGDSSSKFPIKKILSFVVGIAVVLGIIAAIIFIVLPRFSGGNSEEVTLTYWGVWEDSKPLENVGAAFTKEHPNIKIKFEKQDIKALGKYVDRLATRASNGTGPDVFRYHESWVPELNGYLLPIPQDIIKSSELETKYYPTVAKDLKFNGAYYGIPIMFDSLALFVNTELFKNAGMSTYPKGWFDLVDVAKELIVKDAEGKIITSGAALGTYDNVEHASDIMSLLLVQNGAKLTDLAGPTKGNAADAFDYYTGFARGEGKVWDSTLENSKPAFSKGKVAMYIGYSWDIFEIKALNPNLQFAVLPVPNLPTSDSTIASYWVEGVSSKTKHPKEAMEFLKFLATKQTMEKLYADESKVRLFGELYPRSDMASLLKDNTLIYPFVQQGPKAQSTIFPSDTYDGRMDDALNVYMGNAIRSIVDDNTSAESAVDTLAAGVAQVLGQYVSTTQ